MKRASERQITKDDPDNDSSEETDNQTSRQFDRAPPEVLAGRRILKVRRSVPRSNGDSNASANPFAALTTKPLASATALATTTPSSTAPEPTKAKAVEKQDDKDSDKPSSGSEEDAKTSEPKQGNGTTENADSKKDIDQNGPEKIVSGAAANGEKHDDSSKPVENGTNTEIDGNPDDKAEEKAEEKAEKVEEKAEEKAEEKTKKVEKKAEEKAEEKTKVEKDAESESKPEPANEDNQKSKTESKPQPDKSSSDAAAVVDGSKPETDSAIKAATEGEGGEKKDDTKASDPAAKEGDEIEKPAISKTVKEGDEEKAEKPEPTADAKPTTSDKEKACSKKPAFGAPDCCAIEAAKKAEAAKQGEKASGANDATTKASAPAPLFGGGSSIFKSGTVFGSATGSGSGGLFSGGMDNPKRQRVAFGGFNESTPGLTFAQAAKTDNMQKPGSLFGSSTGSGAAGADKGGVADTTNGANSSIGTVKVVSSTDAKREQWQRDLKEEKVETGEEGEDEVFRSRAKLYVLGGKGNEARWKERGVGALKIKRNPETGGARLLMRTEATLIVVLNSPLFPALIVDRATERSVRFQGFDHSARGGEEQKEEDKDKDKDKDKDSDEKEGGKDQKENGGSGSSSSNNKCFLVRFATKDVVATFERAIDDWKNSVKKD